LRSSRRTPGSPSRGGESFAQPARRRRTSAQRKDFDMLADGRNVVSHEIKLAIEVEVVEQAPAA
jgi:hypothetical protein